MKGAKERADETTMFTTENLACPTTQQTLGGTLASRCFKDIGGKQGKPEDGLHTPRAENVLK